MRYFLITFYKKPNNQIDEQVGFSKRLKSSDQSMCNIILDYKERKVVKCVVEGKILPTSFDSMNLYYKQIYPQLIDQLEMLNKEIKKPA